MKSLYHRITSSLSPFVSAWHGYMAAGLLTLMFGLGLTSMAGNSAIVDEVAHISAGYAYLHYGDYRLNPEHPPLIKDLAALPLQLMPLHFPDTKKAWTEDVNGQWEVGWDFLYHLGNDADAVLFWSRLPMLLLAIGFGGFLYWFCRRRWGTAVALLTLFFYCLSPNLIAHSTLVTTDLGASIFSFVAIVVFARFIYRPSGRNLLWLSLALAAAQVAKFSLVLLYPFLGLVALVVAWAMKRPGSFKERLGLYAGGFISASGLSVLWIWLFYAPHTWNMPVAVQDRLIEGSLYIDKLVGLQHFLVNLNNFEIMKPLVQYILGLAMVYNRVVGGNVTYFNGQVSDQSFHAYFPQLFVMKTQVALLVLLLVAIVLAVWRLLHGNPRKALGQWRKHFAGHVLEWALGGFALFYFVVSVKGNLNLGIRHILPIYIPVFVLVAVSTVRRMRGLVRTHWRNLSVVTAAGLLLWYGGSTLVAHPHYLSYFNETMGGPAKADKYFSDSSVDWGQDLRRLKAYVDEHPEIGHIAVDYFGGAIPAYYFCQRQYDERGRLVASYDGYNCSTSVFEEWHSQYGTYTGEYIAVSETFLENDRYYAPLNNTAGYEYLRQREPIAKIGNSIYLYKLR